MPLGVEPWLLRRINCPPVGTIPWVDTHSVGWHPRLCSVTTTWFYLVCYVTVGWHPRLCYVTALRFYMIFYVTVGWHPFRGLAPTAVLYHHYVVPYGVLRYLGFRFAPPTAVLCHRYAVLCGCLAIIMHYAL